jgi:hypothetical protein
MKSNENLSLNLNKNTKGISATAPLGKVMPVKSLRPQKSMMRLKSCKPSPITRGGTRKITAK